MPERIKNESEEMMNLGSPIQESLSVDAVAGMAGLNDSFMEPLLDSISNSHFDQEFNFEFSDHNYRYVSHMSIKTKYNLIINQLQIS